MKEFNIEFDTTNEDTCMMNWVFHMKEDSGSKVIESVEIKREKQGCIGHPKTISALVRNIPIDKLDIAALSKASCSREKSCGMILGSCIEAIQEGKY